MHERRLHVANVICTATLKGTAKSGKGGELLGPPPLALSCCIIYRVTRKA